MMPVNGTGFGDCHTEARARRRPVAATTPNRTKLIDYASKLHKINKRTFQQTKRDEDYMDRSSILGDKENCSQGTWPDVATACVPTLLAHT